MEFFKKNWKNLVAFLVLLVALTGAAFGVKKIQIFFHKAAQKSVPVNVQVSQVGETSAIISWQTEESLLGEVEFGINPLAMSLRAREKIPTTNHQVLLSPLLAGTTYHYRIVQGETSYDTYSFTTKAAAAALPTLTTVSPPESDWTLNNFETKYGTNDPAFDLNKDGIVNAKDWDLHLKQKQQQ